MVPIWLLVLMVFIPQILLAQQVSVQNYTATICPDSTTCGECITSDPNCAWCPDEGYNGTRCDDVINLLQTECRNVTYPQGWLTVVQNDTLTDAEDSPGGRAVQVGPQVINVTLKVGEPQTVRLDVRLANDYPLDLYYFMDLSKSLQDDLNNLRFLAQSLERKLKELTKDHQLGFGTYVDKVSLPFVVVDKNTCTTGSSGTCCPECADPFSFKNELALTNDTARFEEKVGEATISNSIDSPEGGMDALVQVISCQKEIGWRNRARRMVLFATDEGFHMAGDGKMAGIAKPNDGFCHMEAGSNEYFKSSSSDYPSIGQLNALLQEYNIIPVFAVTANIHYVYSEMVKNINGAHLGQLASDSTNVVRIIEQVYKSVTSVVDLDDTAPKNINVSYTSYCVGEKPVPGSSRCDDVILGETLSFDLQITATECSAAGENHIFKVRPFGFDESLTIVANVICNCDCESNGLRDPTRCSYGNGTLTCGQCVCDEGRYGKECECDGESESDQDISSCISPNSTLVCQGRGSCICGNCVCEKQMNPMNVISGRYCECDNFSCARYQGELCGGRERGNCVCGECRCTPDYKGDACDCLSSTKACETPSGLLCNGFGECKCGRCICKADSPFQGPTCEDCPTCIGLCSSFRECVLCKVFDQGYFNDEQCDMCRVTIETVDVIDLNNTETVICQHLDDDNCTIVYTYDMMVNSSYVVYVQESKVCRKIVDTKPQKSINLTWLIVGIIAGILLIGIILLALIRLAIFLQDRKEFAKFEKDRKAAMWSDSDNPLFKSSTSTFLNPMHGAAPRESNKE